MGAREICVIYNPAAGKGRGLRRLEGLRQGLAARADFRPTDRAGHAEDLALNAAHEGYRVVGAAGGDGTVHEVANGLLRSGRADVTLAVFPIGSANDYAHSLGLGPDWWRTWDPAAPPRAVDAGLVRDGAGRVRYFVNGLGLGFNGAVTLESRRIRRLQGVLLYTAALLRALVYHFRAPVMTVELDGVKRIVPTLALTLALGRREGNFVLAPDALLDDGLFDVLHAGAIRRWELVRFFPGMVSGNLPTDHPHLWLGRCRTATVASETPLITHLDGELFCRPEDGVRELDVRILPGALRVAH